MQPSTQSDWGRVMMPLRWLATAIGVIWALLFGVLVLLFQSQREDAMGWVVAGVVVLSGLLAAFGWMGMGELVGGLAFVGVALWIAFTDGFQFWALTISAPFTLAGLLFITCGWYTLAQRRHRTPTATV